MQEQSNRQARPGDGEDRPSVVESLLKLDSGLLPGFLRELDPHVLLSDNYVVLDVETTNIQFGDASVQENRLLLSCYKDGKMDKVLFSEKNEYGIEHIIKRIESADLLVAHNTKMELKWLLRAGMDLSKTMVYCTMVGEHVLAGNRKVAKALGAVSKRYGYGTKDPYVDKLMNKGVCP